MNGIRDIFPPPPWEGPPIPKAITKPIEIAKCLWAYDKFRSEIEDVKRAVDNIDRWGVEPVLDELRYAQIGAERVCRVCPISEDTKEALHSMEDDITRILTGERGAEILRTLEQGKKTLKAELDMYPEIVMNDMLLMLVGAGEVSF